MENKIEEIENIELESDKIIEENITRTKRKKHSKHGKHSFDSKERNNKISKNKKEIVKYAEPEEDDEDKSILNKFFNSIFFVILIGIFMFFKVMFLYNNTIAINEKLEMETIIGTIIFLITAVCILIAIPNRGRIILTLLLDLLFSILIFGDNVYYTYSSSFLSVAQMSNLQYGESIMATLPSLIQAKQIVYFIDIVLIVLLLVCGLVKIEKKERAKKRHIVLRCVSLVTAIVLFIVFELDYIEKGGLKSYNKDMQMRESTVFGYHIYDVENAINIKSRTKYKNEEQVVEAYSELKNDYKEKYGEEQYLNMKGILEGKNVIIVQLESVQEFVVNRIINGKEITPNLNKFLEENIEIKNMNMQSYSTTADSEHSTITSLYPMENGMAFSKYYTNKYDDIFNEFNKKGYHTSYMHGNYPYFWNRGNVYGRLNLDSLELKEQFEDLSENINGDLSDELLYKQAVQKIKDYDQPFFSYIVSASSHTPFSLEGLQDKSKVSIDVGKYKETYFGNYLEAVNYADYAFGEFIKSLKENNLYDDVSIIVYGDHNGLTMYDEEMKDFLSNFDDNITEVDLKLNYTKVLAGIKIPGMENKHLKITKPVSKLDIKPTFAYLCNLDDVFSIGTNMFESKDFVCLNNERIITDKYYYDEDWFNIENGEMLELDKLDDNTKEQLNKYYDYMKRELDISNSVILNNLLVSYTR